MEEAKPEMPAAPLTSESIPTFLENTKTQNDFSVVSASHTFRSKENKIKLYLKPLNTALRICFVLFVRVP